MHIEKTIGIGRITDQRRAVDETENLTPDERVSILEDLRQHTCQVLHHEYPRRLSRLLEIVER